MVLHRFSSNQRLSDLKISDREAYEKSRHGFTVAAFVLVTFRSLRAGFGACSLGKHVAFFAMF